MCAGILRIGTRGSKLALAQTNHVSALIKIAQPQLEIEIVTVTTAGDEDHQTELSKMGTVGLFTGKIEQQLLEDRIDIAVHSAKDLPSQLSSDFAIAAVPPREACEDAWISADESGLRDIGPNKVVGTGSPRRRAQLLNVRRDLRVESIRGNVETRLRKLNDGECDALILACAGLKRSGREDSITELLDKAVFVPAGGQGALVVEVRADDTRSAELTKLIDHPNSHRCLDIERQLLRELSAGCSSAVGANAWIEEDRVHLTAEVLDVDGLTRLTAVHIIDREDENSALVDHVASRLIEQGASHLIASYE